MPQGAHSEQSSASPLRGVLLALLLGEQGRALHGYKLATLVMQRLGPAWEIKRQSVYRALGQLEEEELACSIEKPGLAQGGEGHGRRVFRATSRAESAHTAWMEGPVSKEPVRVELQARIAVSRAQDAPRLLPALDAYERSCFGVLRETQEAEVPMGSWAGLSRNLTRTAVDLNIKAELEWINLARQWIEDYVAEHGSRPA
jgi:DNA-binding PadR family transcriptional regulator